MIASSSCFYKILREFPANQDRLKKIYFDNLLTKLRTKIGGWKRNFLSMAGRLTLIRSVLQSLSFHTMAVLPIPKGVIKNMERIIASFLWDHGNSKHHHWVRMELIKRPKDTGGLDLRSLIFVIPKSRFAMAKQGSLVWNTTSHLIEHLCENSVWTVGDGSSSIDKYCWHHNIPCKSDLKGLPIRLVLSRVPQKWLFLDKVPTFAREYYINAIYETGPQSSIAWSSFRKLLYSQLHYYLSDPASKRALGYQYLAELYPSQNLSLYVAAYAQWAAS